MILCSGVFDGLHAGHVAYLKAAEALASTGEELWVAVASDDYVMREKRRAAKFFQMDRLAAVEAIRWVAKAVGHDEYGAASAIREYRPRLFIKGPDWTAKQMPQSVLMACAEVGCFVAYVSHDNNCHTSSAIPAHQ